MSAKEKKADKKPTAEQQTSEIRVQVEDDRGIHRYKDTVGNITYRELPWFNGKRT